MKKNVLALSIATMIGGLGFAGAASAQATDRLAVNDSGTGHILINPYYNVQNGNMSVFHVVNTDTSNGKAVKVRFRGASNSDDVLDFQVFMSPGDVWTAAISKGADGRAQLTTNDNSCTLPAIAKGVQIPFVTDRLPAAMSDEDKANNTREGYMEILTMADIDGASTYTVDGNSGKKAPLFTASKHVGGVAPCDAAGVLTSTLSTGANTTGLKAPTGGLFGTWYIINVAQTTTYSASSYAVVANPAQDGDGLTRNVFSPQSADPAAADQFSADPLIKDNIVPGQKFDFPDLSTPYFTTNSQAAADSQAAALTESLARGAVLNQYANDASISAKTDWVFSMPTRRYNVAANYSVLPVGGVYPAAYRVFNAAVGNYFNAGNTRVNEKGQICISSIGAVFRDREETAKTSGAVFSPGTLTNTPLCGEVSVLSFADAGTSVLGASVARSNVDGAYVNGWGQINFGGTGIPVLGAAFIKLSNPSAAPGMSGTYGITWPHAYKSVTPVVTP